MTPAPRYKVSLEELTLLMNQSTALVSIIQHQKKVAQTKMPGSRAPPGPWNGANGPRVLTEAQRQRKRERDRATKREEKAKNQQKLAELEQSKERAAQRIRELENEVEILSRSCTCGSRAGATLGVGSSSGTGHSFSSPCRPSSQLSYDSSSNIDPSETGSAESPVYDYPHDNRSDYSDTTFSTQENFGMYYESSPVQVSPIPYRIQTTVPQVSYTAPTMVPTTWASTLHPVSAVSTHSYSPHSPHTPLSGQEPRRYSQWDNFPGDTRGTY